jgi:hypothetical protein
MYILFFNWTKAHKHSSEQANLAQAQAVRIPSFGIHSQVAIPVLLEMKVTTPIAKKKSQAAAATYLDLLLRAAAAGGRWHISSASAVAAGGR